MRKKKIAAAVKPRVVARPRKSAKPAKAADWVVATNLPRQTKLARLQALLRQPGGVTVAVLSRELDWQVHSVRGAISGALKKKLGLKILSEKREGGERTYRIAA